jgi:pheromone a factor receptor
MSSSRTSVVAVSSFIRRRLQFSTFLKTNQSGLTTSRYLRLVALATSDLLISLPLAIFYLVEFTQHLSPWISFDWIHLDFHVVNAFDSTYMARNPDIATRLFLPRWLAPLSAIAFFAFFGLAEDALADYVSIYERIRSYIVRPSQLRNAKIGQM